MFVRFPKRGHHPAAGNTDKATCNDIAEEMKVGTDQPRRSSEGAEDIKGSPRWVESPQNRNDGTGNCHVPRGERRVFGSAMKEIKPVDAVLNKSPVLFKPRLSPS